MVKKCLKCSHNYLKPGETIIIEFAIRKAVLEDADQIAGLMEELGYPNTSAFIQTKITELSNNTNDLVLVAEVDESRVIGAAHLHIADFLYEPSRTGRIMAIVVANNYRHLGVGRKLMDSLEAAAQTAGCSRMEITTAIHRNDAHTFYTRLGYTDKPRRFVKILCGNRC